VKIRTRFRHPGGLYFFFLFLLQFIILTGKKGEQHRYKNNSFIHYLDEFISFSGAKLLKILKEEIFPVIFPGEFYFYLRITLFLILW